MKLIAGAALASCLFFAAGEPKPVDVFFQEGATLVYKGQAVFAESKDVRYTCMLRIDKVEVNGNHRSSVAGIAYSFHGETPANAAICRFACDSLNFYCNALNFAQRSVLEQEEGKANDSGDSLIYPFSMKVGDTLPGAWYKTTVVNSELTYTNEVRFIKRRVESVDTLNLGVGKIAAYRITMTEVAARKSVSSHTGSQNNSETFAVTEWFHPFYGVVKMQKDRSNGADLIELVSYKMH